MRRGRGKGRGSSRRRSNALNVSSPPTPQQLIGQEDQDQVNEDQKEDHVQEDQVKDDQVKEDHVQEDQVKEDQVQEDGSMEEMEVDKRELTEDHLGDEEKVEQEGDDNSSLVKAKPCHPGLTKLLGPARTQSPDCCPIGMKKSRNSAPPNLDKRQEVKTEPGTQKTLKSHKEPKTKLETATRSGRIVHPRNLFMTSVYSTPQQRRSLQFPPLGEAASTGATTTRGFKGFSDSWRDIVLSKRLKKEVGEGGERRTENVVHKCIMCNKGFPGFKELYSHVTDRSSPCRFNRSLWTDKKSDLVVKKYKTENNDNQESSRPLVNEVHSPDSPDIEETNQKIASTESEVTQVTEESHKPQYQAQQDQEQQQEERELQELAEVTELSGPRRTESMESQQTEPIDIDNEFPLMSPQPPSQPNTSFSSPMEDEHNEQDDKAESKNSADIPDVEETDEGKQKQEGQENLQMDADDVKPILPEGSVPACCRYHYSVSVHRGLVDLVDVPVVPVPDDDEMNDSLATGPNSSSATTTSSVSMVSMSPRRATDAEDEDDDDCAIIEEISSEEVSKEELEVVESTEEEEKFDDSEGAGDQFLFHLNFEVDFDNESQNDSGNTGNTSETSEILDCEPEPAKENKYNEDEEKMRFEEEDHLNSLIPDPGATGPAPVRPDVVTLLPINDGKNELSIPNESEENHHEKEERINTLFELLDQPGPEKPSDNNASGTSGGNSGSDMDKQSKPTKVVQPVQPQRRSERKRKAKVIQDAYGTAAAAPPAQGRSNAKGKAKEMIRKQVKLAFCPICGLDVPADELEDHKRSHEMECDICGRDDLRINEEFAAHGATHVGNQLDCEEEGCGYAAYGRRDLWHHANKEHRKTNPWICLECGCAFPTATMYKLHTKGCHHPGHIPFAKSP